MNLALQRRSFLKKTAALGAAVGFADLGFLSRLPLGSAAETRLDAKFVQFRPESEPLVQLLEETPRGKLLEEVASRIKRGTTYREVLAALQLASVRNIQGHGLTRLQVQFRRAGGLLQPVAEAARPLSRGTRVLAQRFWGAGQ